MIDSIVSVGDLVVPSICYPMSMCSRPSVDFMSSEILWQEEMNAIVVDLHEGKDSIFVKLLTSAGTIGWVSDAFVKLSK